MCTPIGTGQPLRLGLAGGQIVGDFNIIKAYAPRHGVLVGNHRPHSAKVALKARHSQPPCDGKGAAIVKGGEGYADQFQSAKIGQHQGRIIGLRKVERALVCRNLGQGDRGYDCDGLKAVIVHNDTHTVGS